MPQKVYFDTVSFREIGNALQKTALPDDLRDYIIVSPLSAFEGLSQLTICLNATSAAPTAGRSRQIERHHGRDEITNRSGFCSASRCCEKRVTEKKESPKGDWFSEAWFQGFTKRVKADPKSKKSKTAKQLADAFSAYHELSASNWRLHCGQRNITQKSIKTIFSMLNS
jgi:hypothetical protein